MYIVKIKSDPCDKDVCTFGDIALITKENSFFWQENYYCREILLSSYKRFYKNYVGKFKAEFQVFSNDDYEDEYYDEENDEYYEEQIEPEEIYLTDSEIDALLNYIKKSTYGITGTKNVESKYVRNNYYTITSDAKLILHSLYFSPEFLSLVLLLIKYHDIFLKEEVLSKEDIFYSTFLRSDINEFEGIYAEKVLTCYYNFSIKNRQFSTTLLDNTYGVEYYNSSNGPATYCYSFLFSSRYQFSDFMLKYKELIEENDSDDDYNINEFFKFAETFKREG